MKTLHAKWARYYDFTYEHSCGNLYPALTEAVLEENRAVGPPGRIAVDFSAGTVQLIRWIACVNPMNQAPQYPIAQPSFRGSEPAK